MMHRSSSASALSLLGGLVVVVCALVACGFPDDLPPDSTTPDPSGLQLEEGSASDGTEARDAGRPTSDASTGSAKTADAATTDATVALDASPALQTFTVSATECNGGRCRAGYDGTEDPGELETATKVCAGHGLLRATDFTLVNDKPGGKFCRFRSGAFSCDSSCSGCNPMGTVVCSAH